MNVRAMILNYKKQLKSTENQLVVCEGLNACNEAARNKIKFEAVFLNKKANLKLQNLQTWVPGFNSLVLEADEKELSALSSTKTPYPIIALVALPDNLYSYPDTFPGSIPVSGLPPVSVGLENIRDPNNLGNIIRTSSGFNCKTLFLFGDTVFPYSPKVIRSSAGTIFQMQNIIRVQENVLQSFKNNLNPHMVALSLNGSLITRSINGLFDTATGRPIIFLFGNEGNGLSGPMLNLAESRYIIPMNPEVESLNVGNSVAIVLWEYYKHNNSLD